MTMTTNTGTVALVTGGSRGLGRNTAHHLARRGVGVVLTYHSNRTEADAAVAEIASLGSTAAALQLDAAAVPTFDDFATELRAVLQRTWNREDFDYLVNNAGTGLHARFADTTEAQFDAMMNIHLKGVFFLTQKLLPMLKDGGRIVNLSSGLARFAMPGYSAYAAMKGGVEVLTRYLAKELGERGIAVNTVAPGAIATDFGGGVVRDNEQVNRAVAAATALGRVGQADDIGPMIASLLTPDNRWVNAQRIEVSGGVNI
jgi:NAD(P)-dependent dehydrogenase (short-subunit alcohol dehydrogenase family)